MLVYGDHVREADPRTRLAELCDQIRGYDLEARDALPIERHGRRAALFIDTAELAQALADAATEVAGGDGPTPLETAALGLLTPLAEALIVSWGAIGRGEAACELDVARLDAAILALQALPMPPMVRLKTGEGYAYYALYPEAYAEAAVRSGLKPDAAVIGIRSIGLGLAAMVAAACGAESLLSVRPGGHPFRRELRLTEAMDRRLRTITTGEIAIVDEGPGLSGSSFGAVADALEARGVAPERIVFFPSHAGDLGAQASSRHRTRWATARRALVELDGLLVRTDHVGHRLSAWFADLAGGEGRLQDVSGGGWRAHACGGRLWPAANSLQERRKFLLAGADGPLLLKFAGLGSFGERAFQAERRLAAADFAPEPLALRHGFVGRRWLAAHPLELEAGEQAAFVAHLGRYLGWRAVELAAPAGGASPADLLQMARVNAVEALGDGAALAAGLDAGRWADLPPSRPVWTDNRLHRHEWLRTDDGRWLKCDAVDHALAHDLVGPQDVAWDVAGAAVEFDLDAAERRMLLEVVSEQAPVEPALVDALETAYLAFQFAAYAMAASAHAHWLDEQGRLAQEAGRYRSRLAARLSA